MRELIRKIIFEQIRTQRNTESFIEDSKKVHGDKYDYSHVDYKTTKIPVEIICPKHGPFFKRPLQHLEGSGCPKCVEWGKHLKSSNKDFIKSAQEVHGDKYDYSQVDYKNTKTLIKIICPKHGEFLQLPYVHLRGSGCEKCAKDTFREKKGLGQETFIKLSKELHGNKYDYSQVIYQTNKKKVKLGCPIHGFFEIQAAAHLNGQGCGECGRSAQRSNTEEFIENAIQIHGDKYDYSLVDYFNQKKPVRIICPEHGEFLQTPTAHINQKSECPFCAGNLKKTTEDFINDALKIHGNKYDYSLVNYDGKLKPVEIVCTIHGKFNQTPATHLNGGGCPECGVIKRTLGNTHNEEIFISNAKKIHSDQYDYSKVKYTNSKTPVEIICKKHGSFFQKPNHHLTGQGCPVCQESTGERLISRILETHEVKYERQKRFIDCKSNNRKKRCVSLPFDFYIPSYKTCVEFDGIQHFQPIQSFGGEDTFKSQKKRDKIKNQYCEKNNIKLIRIPYTMSPEEIEIYLLMELGITD